jgi:hypothetical protein
MGVISSQSFGFTHFYNNKNACVNSRVTVKTGFPLCRKLFWFSWTSHNQDIASPCSGKGACAFVSPISIHNILLGKYPGLVIAYGFLSPRKMWMKFA